MQLKPIHVLWLGLWHDLFVISYFTFNLGFTSLKFKKLKLLKIFDIYFRIIKSFYLIKKKGKIENVFVLLFCYFSLSGT